MVDGICIPTIVVGEAKDVVAVGASMVGGSGAASRERRLYTRAVCFIKSYLSA